MPLATFLARIFAPAAGKVVFRFAVFLILIWNNNGISVLTGLINWPFYSFTKSWKNLQLLFTCRLRFHGHFPYLLASSRHPSSQNHNGLSKACPHSGQFF